MRIANRVAARRASPRRGPLAWFRDLPLAWKMGSAPLLMVLVFTLPVFAIIRDLTSRAGTDLNARLQYRASQSNQALQQDEFYVLDSVRLGANLQGLPKALEEHDIAGVTHVFGSVIALKDRLDLLVASDASGEVVVQVTGTRDHRFVQNGKQGTVPLRATAAVREVLAGSAQPRAGLVTLGERTLLVVAAPVSANGSKLAGVVLAGIDAGTVITNAVQTGTSTTLFDLTGRAVATSGSFAVRSAPTAAPAAGLTATQTIAHRTVTTVFEPYAAGGERVGTLAVTIERAPAYALAKRVTRNLELLLFTAVAAGVGLLFLLARLLLAQVATIAETNRKLGEGTFDARATVMGGDELGSVAAGLNDMATRLQASHEELEDRVVERTAALEVARDAAQMATRAKAQFLANMSHEIRTPMNAVIGMTSLMLDSKLSPQQRDYIETIRMSGDHLLGTINEILDFSKIEAGRFELELHPFVLRTCVEDALDLVAQAAAEKKIELAYRIEDGVPVAVLGDAGRTRQVLLNLLSNAVKFTEKGEVVVRVISTPDHDGRWEIRFDVRDTGPGIPANRLEELFEAFAQGDLSTTRTQSGTGLGLAISRLLAGLMGGKVWGESQLGKGSMFSFTILAEEADAPPEGIIDVDLQGRRVLIVDDRKTNRTIVTEYVKRWGMSPTAVATPSAALKLLASSKRYDLVILDHRLPEMDGAELARTMRKSHPDLAAILLSSVRELSTQDSLPFAVTLAKPIKPSLLLEAVTQALFGSAPRARKKASRVLDRTMGTRRPLRILVAEDNLVNQKVIAAVLGKLGYSPDFAATGIEVLDALERQRYDVVFLDVQMPQMDGLEASREIHRRWPQGARPRIVAMTANVTPEDRKDCLAAGMEDYLTKPVRVTLLVEALERCSPIDYGSTGNAPRTRGLASGTSKR